jgi:hypothetical protein
MAVVQISRIQIRRGKKNVGSGMPQLAGGEMAWAVDSQELYIGNGAVSDGAPAVGNTKIITENDNLIDLIGLYQYDKNNPAIQTGPDANYPVTSTIQDVLDRFVSAENFGIVGNGVADDTAAIQRAVDQLFLNEATVGLVEARVELLFGAGTFRTTSTIYLPSYVSITGKGISKTNFNYTGTGSAFEFINDTSTSGNPSLIASTTLINQPKYASLRDFTILVGDSAQGLELNAVRDSLFENIAIQGTWTSVDGNVSNSIGIGMNALSLIVTCQRNTFRNIVTKNLCYGIWSKQDIFNNVFDECKFNNLQYGVAFGIGTLLAPAPGVAGEQYGPRKNVIKNSIFDTIDRNGIIIDNGYGNRSRSNSFINVGNDGGDNSNGIYSHIKFTVQASGNGNSSSQDSFDRSKELADPNAIYGGDTYVPEVEGTTYFENLEPKRINGIGPSPTQQEIFRLPIGSSTGFSVKYVWQSATLEQMRKGTLNIAVDFNNENIELVDEYESTLASTNDEKVIFYASIVNGSVVIYYTNSNVSDNAALTYTYSVIS